VIVIIKSCSIWGNSSSSDSKCFEYYVCC